MLKNLTALIRKLSPSYRRVQAKRHLETLLKEHGLPRAAIKTVSWKFFNNERPKL